MGLGKGFPPQAGLPFAQHFWLDYFSLGFRIAGLLHSWSWLSSTAETVDHA